MKAAAKTNSNDDYLQKMLKELEQLHEPKFVAA